MEHEDAEIGANVLRCLCKITIYLLGPFIYIICKSFIPVKNMDNDMGVQ